MRLKSVLGIFVLGSLTLSAFGRTTQQGTLGGDAAISSLASGTAKEMLMVKEKEPGDDRGHRKGEPERKDDKNHKKPYYVACEKEPGDDRGREKREPGDDRGRGRHREPGDDRGRHS
jgi:hypothetical protein